MDSMSIAAIRLADCCAQPDEFSPMMTVVISAIDVRHSEKTPLVFATPNSEDNVRIDPAAVRPAERAFPQITATRDARSLGLHSAVCGSKALTFVMGNGAGSPGNSGFSGDSFAR